MPLFSVNICFTLFSLPGFISSLFLQEMWVKLLNMSYEASPSTLCMDYTEHITEVRSGRRGVDMGQKDIGH